MSPIIDRAENHIKGRLGQNFAKIIGEHTYDDDFFYTCQFVEADYGFDIDVKQQGYRIVGDRHEQHCTNKNITLQIKTHSDVSIDGNEVVYPLDSSNYRTIVDANRAEGASKAALVVVNIPQNLSHSISLQHPDTLLKIQGYWCIPEYDATKYNNATSVTLRFNKSQLFDSQTICTLYSQLFS